MRKLALLFFGTVFASGLAAQIHPTDPRVQSPAQRIGNVANSSTQKAKLTPLKLGALTTLPNVSNSHALQTLAATRQVLEKQAQGAQLESAQIHGSALTKPNVQLGTSRTMSASGAAGPGGFRSATTSAVGAPTSTIPSRPGIGSLAPNQPTTTLTCSQNPTLRILHISGGTGPATFTPQQGLNFYTVTGCSFGDPGVNAKVYAYSGGNFRIDFQVEEWNDNGIKMRVDPNLRGVTDHDNLTLVLQRNDGKQFTNAGYKFYAARENVLLDHFPKTGFSLNKFTPTKTSDLTVQYSSPSSQATVPNIPGYTSGIGWQCSDCYYNSDRPNFSYYTPSAEDIYSFKDLQPGFLPSEASLVHADLQCPSGPLHREGNFAARWVNDELHVQWQGQTCTTSGCGGFGQPDCFISPPGSNYAVRLWVQGPRGVDPWTGRAR